MGERNTPGNAAEWWGLAKAGKDVPPIPTIGKLGKEIGSQNSVRTK